MKSLKHNLVGLLLIVCTMVVGQQQSQYSMYMMNNYTLNPAVGGTESYTDLKASFRKQWAGFNGSPTNVYVSGHTALGKTQYDDPSIMPLAHHGVGGYVYRDQAGALSKTGLYGSYAYHLPLTTKLTVSVGTFLGFQQYTLNDNDLVFHDDQYGTSDAVLEDKLSKFLPDASLGTWLYHKDYYVGIALHQIFGNSVDFNTIENATTTGQLNGHFFATAGYRLALSDDLTCVPSFVIKAVSPAPVQFDINAKFKYKEMVWGGLSYRNKDAIVLLAGVTLAQHWDVGYAYDVTTSGLNQHSKGSHEFLIGYRIAKDPTVQPTSQFW